jgi:lipocalin
MRASLFALWAACAAAAAAQPAPAPPAPAPAPAPAGPCPPPGFAPERPDFDLARFAAAPWFVLAQAPLSWLPPDSLFCVRTKYRLVDPATLEAFDCARRGSVAGPVVGLNGPREYVCIPNRGDPSKFSVEFTPPGAPAPVAAPLWVAWTDPDYRLAIVTAGPPSAPGAAGGCAVPPPGGLWLFSRAPVDPAGEAALWREAARLGLDLASLAPVTQAGCQY